MSKDLTALLGCVQGEVSYSDPSGRPQVHESCLTERVALPVPRDGAHNVAVTCKHCQQAVRIQVRSRHSVRRKRLASRLALAVSVCLWAAATAMALLFFLDQHPATPGGEVLLAGILIAFGAVLWASVDQQAAFASDVVAGCTIERAPVEKAWATSVSPEVMQGLPRHVLLDPGQDLATASFGAELARTISTALRKPRANLTTVAPVTQSPMASRSTGTA